MKNDFENTYKMIAVNKDKLQSLGFKYSKSSSDSENELYIYRFPVSKYKKHSTLTCELLVELHSGDVIVNVYDNNDNFYTPFYQNRCGNFHVMSIKIKKSIMKEFKKMEIKKCEDKQ